MGCGASKNDLSSSSENQQQDQEPQPVEVSNNKNEQSEEATTEKNSEEEEKETIKEDDILVENMEGDDDDEAKNNANASTNILPTGNDSSSNGVDPLASIAGGNASSLGIPSLTTFPTVAVKASSGNNNDGNENSISIGQSSTNSTSRKKLVADDIIMEDAFDVEDDVQQASSRRTASGIFGPRGTSSMRKGSSIVTTSLTSPTKVTGSSSSPTSNKPTSMRPGRLAANRPPPGSTMKNAVKMAGAAGANFGGFSAAPGRR